MAPFFLKQYVNVKSHAYDVFEAYPTLLTEMVLRIPYEMKKIADNGGDQPKEQYRQLRDLHTLEARIKVIRSTVVNGGFDPSDTEHGSVSSCWSATPPPSDGRLTL